MTAQSTVNGGTRLHGAIEAATAFLNDTVSLAGDMHRAIARKPFAALQLAPGVADVSAGTRFIHDGITDLVYGCIRAGITVTGAAAKIAASFATSERDDPNPEWMTDMAVAALNGFAGDRLSQAGNPLAASMEVRHDGRRVAIERDCLVAAFPRPSRRLAVFVHGLASNECIWSLYSQRHHATSDTTYGSLLEADLDYTPVYLRYNTGLHISENGRGLARLLDRLLREWPADVDEVALIGHSMGGLVIRSACHYGSEEDRSWVSRIGHVVFLGSPHLGAPLEKGVNIAAWCLGLTDVTRPLAVALNRRSVGIKDLRFGSLCDEDWQSTDLDGLLSGRPRSIGLLDGARHYFVAATVTRDPRHPLGRVVGDLLVREPSASGPPEVHHSSFVLRDGRHFGSMSHLGLVNHPDVYRQMRQWLDGARQTPVSP